MSFIWPADIFPLCGASTPNVRSLRTTTAGCESLDSMPLLVRSDNYAVPGDDLALRRREISVAPLPE